MVSKNSSPTSFLATSLVWHNRLCYVSDPVVHNVLRKNKIFVIKSSNVCEACELAKSHKFLFLVYTSDPLNSYIWTRMILLPLFLLMKSVIVCLLFMTKVILCGYIFLKAKD